MSEKGFEDNLKDDFVDSENMTNNQTEGSPDVEDNDNVTDCGNRNIMN